MAIMNAASRARPGLPAEHSGSGPEIELLWSERLFGRSGASTDGHQWGVGMSMADPAGKYTAVVTVIR